MFAAIYISEGTYLSNMCGRFGHRLCAIVNY